MRPPAEPLRSEQTNAWLKQILEKGASGDWLVTRGYKKADDLVVIATNIPLSHSAVLDREKEEIIEAVGKGVLITPLRAFLTKSHRVLLIRPKWWSPETGKKAVEHARELEGKAYDYFGTLGMGSSKKFYCSELCVYVYKENHSNREHLPKVIEPGQLYLWGSVSYDSGTRD